MGVLARKYHPIAANIGRRYEKPGHRVHSLRLVHRHVVTCCGRRRRSSTVALRNRSTRKNAAESGLRAGMVTIHKCFAHIATHTIPQIHQFVNREFVILSRLHDIIYNFFLFSPMSGDKTPKSKYGQYRRTVFFRRHIARWVYFFFRQGFPALGAVWFLPCPYVAGRFPRSERGRRSKISLAVLASGARASAGLKYS